MKKILIFALFLMLTVSTAQAASYDMAYYLGLVTAPGGSTLTDRKWLLTDERGSEYDMTAPADSAYYDNPENAQLIHSDNGFVMITSFWYDDDAPAHWVTNSTRVFVVGDDYIEYCAVYLHDEETSLIPNKRFRFARYMEPGDHGGGKGETTVSVSGTSMTMETLLNFHLQEENITLVENTNLPSGTADITGCLRSIVTELSPVSSAINVQVLAPGRGPTIYRQAQYSTDEDPSGTVSGGEIDFYLADLIPAQGDGSSYATTLGEFTNEIEIIAIHATISGLTIPSDHYEEETGNGGAVAVPLF